MNWGASLWRYMASPTKHHMSSNKTRRAELGFFLLGITVSALIAIALLGLAFLFVRAMGPA